MLPYGVPPATPTDRRPAISEVTEDPSGKSFTIRFEPGQRLPAHRNSARIAILVTRGAGLLTVEGDLPRAVREGDLVQLDPRVVHALEAPDEALEVQVLLRANCCEHC